MKIIWRIFFIFLCGYLFIEWFPITHLINISDILVAPIIYPLEFFAASLALFLGLVCSVQLLQQMYKLTIKGVKKKRSKH